MDQTDRPVVVKRRRIRALRQQDQQGLVKTLEHAPAHRE
jgi:hypothetical protein